MARIDRAHDRVLHEMFGPGIDVCAGVDQNKYVCFRRKHRRDTRPIDPGQRAQA